jgi:hypothetical protein
LPLDFAFAIVLAVVFAFAYVAAAFMRAQSLLVLFCGAGSPLLQPLLELEGPGFNPAVTRSRIRGFSP